MPVVYSLIHQTQIDQSNYPQYGITKPDESEYSYFQVDFNPLKYCGGHRNLDETDYLFLSTTGNLKDATFFGKVENYQYSWSGGGGAYASVDWIGSEEDITNFNVPHSRGVRGIAILPHFFGVGEREENPLRFFVERPKDEAETATCFESVKKMFTGSGTKRRRKIKRKYSNKKRKQKKSKRRRTKKNKIRPVMYGGTSIKQYGIASALRSLIFTYFPQKSFDIINLPEDDSLNKYGLTNKYTTVMELLNQIVHNDDGRATLAREDKFGDFLEYSQDLDNLLSDIISDIKQYFYEPKVSNKISPKEIMEISGLINSIQDELVRTTGLRSEKELPANVARVNVASAANVAQATNVAQANVEPKNNFLKMLLAASHSLPKK